MSTVSFDTLKLARKLESAGFTHEQATGAAEALADTFTDSVSTKSDLKELELRLTIRMGVMFGANIGIIALLLKLFINGIATSGQ